MTTPLTADDLGVPPPGNDEEGFSDAADPVVPELDAVGAMSVRCTHPNAPPVAGTGGDTAADGTETEKDCGSVLLTGVGIVAAEAALSAAAMTYSTAVAAMGNTAGTATTLATGVVGSGVTVATRLVAGEAAAALVSVASQATAATAGAAVATGVTTTGTVIGVAASAGATLIARHGTSVVRCTGQAVSGLMADPPQTGMTGEDAVPPGASDMKQLERGEWVVVLGPSDTQLIQEDVQSRRRASAALCDLQVGEATVSIAPDPPSSSAVKSTVRLTGPLHAHLAAATDSEATRRRCRSDSDKPQSTPSTPSTPVPHVVKF